MEVLVIVFRVPLENCTHGLGMKSAVPVFWSPGCSAGVYLVLSFAVGHIITVFCICRRQKGILFMKFLCKKRSLLDSTSSSLRMHTSKLVWTLLKTTWSTPKPKSLKPRVEERTSSRTWSRRSSNSSKCIHCTTYPVAPSVVLPGIRHSWHAELLLFGICQIDYYSHTVMTFLFADCKTQKNLSDFFFILVSNSYLDVKAQLKHFSKHVFLIDCLD